MHCETGQIGHRVDKKNQLRWGGGWRLGVLRKEISKKVLLKLK